MRVLRDANLHTRVARQLPSALRKLLFWKNFFRIFVSVFVFCLRVLRVLLCAHVDTRRLTYDAYVNVICWCRSVHQSPQCSSASESSETPNIFSTPNHDAPKLPKRDSATPKRAPENCCFGKTFSEIL